MASPTALSSSADARSHRCRSAPKSYFHRSALRRWLPLRACREWEPRIRRRHRRRRCACTRRLSSRPSLATNLSLGESTLQPENLENRARLALHTQHHELPAIGTRSLEERNDCADARTVDQPEQGEV